MAKWQSGKVKSFVPLCHLQPETSTLKPDHPPTPIQAILFDLDGTLVDTDDQAVARLAKRLRSLFPNRAKPLARRLVMAVETPGNSTITLLDILGLDAFVFRQKDRMYHWWHPHHVLAFHLLEGVEEMIMALRPRYRMALVTTRDRKHIRAFLNAFPAIDTAIEVSCGLEDTARLKPHPAPLWHAAAQLGVPIQNCLMVGDTTVDVKAARRAGALSAAVLCGFGQQRELERAGAHHILPTTAHLPQILAHYP